MNLFTRLFSYKSGEITPANIRLALVFAFVIYGGFGLIDIFMMPLSYKASWFIRFAIITPLIVITFILSFFETFTRHEKIILFSLLTFGQLGIISMIWVSQPSEPSYYAYYAGLILVILWSNFIFHLRFRTSLYMAVSTVFYYDLAVIIKQPETFSTPEGWAVFIGNNAFLVSAALLTVIGNYQLDKHKIEIAQINKELLIEKEELKKAKEQAVESERLKSAFLANMSHEIRTPMNGIIGFSEMLNQPDFDEKNRAQYTQIVIDSSKQLLTIVNDVLDISIIDSGRMALDKQPVCLNTMLTDLHVFFKPLFDEKNLGFQYKKGLSNEDSCIRTDSMRLRQILSNLLNNAHKFTHEGGVEFGYRLNQNELLFYVQDSGIGVQPEKQHAIFERFQQEELELTRQYGGAGLGLSISQKLVELLGGKIWVESKKGEGSVFYFTHPYEYAKVEVLFDKAVPELDHDCPLTLLIAEDEVLNFMYLESLLSEENLTLIHAKNGMEAVEKCRNSEDVDLVLMDIKMPKMNGYDATRKIRAFRPNLPIIAQTAFAMAEDKERAKAAGCNGYISKPIDPTELLEVIGRFV